MSPRIHGVRERRHQPIIGKSTPVSPPRTWPCGDPIHRIEWSARVVRLSRWRALWQWLTKRRVPRAVAREKRR